MTTTASYTTDTLLLTTAKVDWQPRKNIGVHRSEDGMVLVTVQSHVEAAAFWLSAHDAKSLARTLTEATA
jgi:hypothetical protein